MSIKKNNLPYQPFIILGTARTGSTLLWSYLNSHPSVLCLRGVYGSTKKINFGKFYGELPEEYHSSELINLRNQSPIDFLETYVWKEYVMPFKAVGFKYFYNHDRHLSYKDELINYFKENRSIKFLHLKRHNLWRPCFLIKEHWHKKSGLMLIQTFMLQFPSKNAMTTFNKFSIVKNDLTNYLLTEHYRLVMIIF